MTGDTRQQRRKELRERIKVGERGIAIGLPQTPRRADAVAVAEVLRSKLSEAGNDRRASEAAQLAHRLGEQSMRAYPPRANIACTKGCSYCCYSFVGVTPPEVFRLAEAVRRSKAVGLGIEAVRARTEPLRGISPLERIGRKLPCPLLVEGACSVYADRPLVCRQATSLSLQSCIDEFENIGTDDRVEVSEGHLAHAGNAHVVLLGALLAAGFPIDAFELAASLDVALADSESERRWLAGEDVFAALPRNVQRPREVEMVARAIAAELARQGLRASV
jgi:hypothetical protein